MIPKSGRRFSEKIMLHKLERDDGSKKRHPALGMIAALIGDGAHG
jgi:hypothetical protein